MKYLDEFSNPELAASCSTEIHATCTQPWAIMEVCGGQTHSIIRHGIDQLLPDEIEMIHGPGCPVCVTPLEIIDKALAIAARPGRDLLLLRRHAAGAGQQTGPVPGQERGRRRPGRVLAAGRAEARAGEPRPAGGLLRHRLRDHRAGQRDGGLPGQAARHPNFSLLVSHVLVPPAIEAIMESPTCRVQAFLAAGHVCSVMGTAEYPPLAERYRVPIVVTGFEPLDILEGIRRTVQQLEAGRHEVENAYAARRHRRGQPGRAGDAARTSSRSTDRAWRGIGMIPRQRLAAAPSRTRVRRRAPLRGRRHPHRGVAVCRQRRGAAGSDQAARVRRVRHASARRATRSGATMVSSRGRLRRLLPVPAARARPPAGAVASRWPEAPATRRPTGLRRAGPARCRCATRPTVVMGHGGGGAMSAELIEHLFLPAFGDGRARRARRLGGASTLGGARLAFSTDSFVVRPLFFPGGTIGDLAVNGTVNDLAMCGATPLLPVDGVHPRGGHRAGRRRPGRAAPWARRRARRASRLVTGDTKVVDAGHGDGVYVNTAGIGLVADGRRHPPGPGRRRRRGDRQRRHRRARHRDHERAARAWSSAPTIDSDCAPLHGLVAAMLGAGADLHVLRDPTRGGLADVAERDRGGRPGVGVSPRSSATCRSRTMVGNACGLLGLDPLYVANEGKLVAFVPASDADAVLAAMRAHPLGGGAAVIGECVADHPGMVVATTGARRHPRGRPADRRAAAADLLRSPGCRPTPRPGPSGCPAVRHRASCIRPIRLPAERTRLLRGGGRAGVAGRRLGGGPGCGARRPFHDRRPGPGFRWGLAISGIPRRGCGPRRPARYQNHPGLLGRQRPARRGRPGAVRRVCSPLLRHPAGGGLVLPGRRRGSGCPAPSQFPRLHRVSLDGSAAPDRIPAGAGGAGPVPDPLGHRRRGGRRSRHRHEQPTAVVRPAVGPRGGANRGGTLVRRRTVAAALGAAGSTGVAALGLDL